jgi:outer membrane protein assembly factor BamB
VDADNQLVFGAEGDGKVFALRAANGDTAWESDKLKYRNLLAPVVVGRSVAVADESGWVHLLSREDGTLLKRLSTEGSSPVAAPTLAAGTLIVVTRKGAVFGFRPE